LLFFTKLENTIFITDQNILISKGVVVDPLDMEIYSVVQGDIKTTKRFSHKKYSKPPTVSKTNRICHKKHSNATIGGAQTTFQHTKTVVQSKITLKNMRKEENRNAKMLETM
jgi:hypothetical protein